MGRSTSEPLREIAGFACAGAGAFVLLALASFEAQDYGGRTFPLALEVRNLGGVPGRNLAGFLFDWVGVIPSYVLGAGTLLAGLRLTRSGRAPAAARPSPLAPVAEATGGPRFGEPVIRVGPDRHGGGGAAPEGPQPDGAAREAGASRPWPLLAFARPLGLLSAIFALATIEHLLHRAGLLTGEHFPGRNPGGYWGAYLATALLESFRPAVGYGLASFAGAVGLALALDVDLIGRGRARARGRAGGGALPSSTSTSTRTVVPEEAIVRFSPATWSTAPEAPGPAPATPASPPPLLPFAAPAAGVAEGEDEEEGYLPEPPAGTPAGGGRQLLLPDFEAAPDPLGPETRYALPPLTMLTPAEAGPVEEYETIMREKAQVLARTLANFKIDARVVAVDRGPNITQYELELAAGVKVHRIMSLGDDIAMAMKAPSIRIIAPIPGRSTVGVEVPNQDQETVRLRELLESDEYARKDHAIPLFLGKDSTGNPLIADLARMPHLLIAGATGSGKSVCMNTVIASVLMTRMPSQVKMILIDPKMVELSLYESIPHLLAPVVTDMRKAPSVLEWAVNKMEERYGLLSRAAVRHIKNYNALGPAEIAARLAFPPESGGRHESPRRGDDVMGGSSAEEYLEREKVPVHLPYIVVVIDEFADLMCVARKEVEGSIIRLAQKSRAVGIHLILATQRPTADVITGLIKSNMPCRIAFQVASKVDSRTIIDKNGAEMLVGQGDMLYLPPGTANVIRAQGTYISEEEVKAVVKFSKSAAEPEFHPELVKWEGGEGPTGDGPQDELYDQAVRIVLESQRGSASLLQRRLEIGYSRASRLIDIMTERGILGPFKGSKAREILLSLEDFEAMRARARGEG